MNDWYDDFLAEFVPPVAALLGIDYPAPAGTLNIMTSLQAQGQNFIAQLNDRAGAGWKFVPPGMFLGFGDPAEKPDEFEMNASLLMRMPLTVIAVWRTGGALGNQNSTFPSILKVKKFIEARPSTFETFQRIEQGKIMSSVDAPLNMDLRGDGQGPVTCSALIYNPGVLVQLY